MALQTGQLFHPVWRTRRQQAYPAARTRLVVNPLPSDLKVALCSDALPYRVRDAVFVLHGGAPILLPSLPSLLLRLPFRIAVLLLPRRDVRSGSDRSQRGEQHREQGPAGESGLPLLLHLPSVLPAAFSPLRSLWSVRSELRPPLCVYGVGFAPVFHRIGSA